MRFPPVLYLVIFPSLFLTIACQQPSSDSPANTQTTPETSAAPLTDAKGQEVIPDTEFNPHLGEYIQTLASDEFQGRMPASVGEEKTIAFLQQRFQAAGLQPGNNGSFLQAVPLVEITALETSPLRISGATQTMEFPFREEMVTWTKRVVEEVSVENSDIVFVGYGVVAPEYGWNDYDGMDVAGKTVLILVNDPGFATGDDDLFRGRTMTYYGRWTYKFEEAARQGAAMALVIHETEAAGYGFDVVQGSWTGAQFDLATEDRNLHRTPIEGWVSGAAASQIAAAAGYDLSALKKAALDPGFQAISFDLKASAHLRNSLRESDSHNVVAVLPGSEHPDEYFVYTAHWDHLGVDKSLEGDQIYNGAQDNATGTAALLALAENFAAGPRPKRSLAFVAVTAEESGLLGSRYFGEHPPFPINKMVAGINMDALNINGPMRDLVVVGYGNSELEPIAERLAGEQNRRVVPNPSPEKGFYYRSDHFNLAKKGVPMLYARAGHDHFEKGSEYGLEKAGLYVRERYHKPADEYGDWWDLRGINQDLNLFFRMGADIANSDDWPNWYQGNEFRALRDQSLL